MNLFKKAAVLLTASTMVAANSFGYVPLTSIELPAFTSNAAEIVESGECGENLTWTLDSEGTLTISGEGEMVNFKLYDESPWYANENIKKVIIDEGVTSIGGYAFNKCESLTTVVFSKSITKINAHAFDYTSWLNAQRDASPLIIVNDILFDGYACVGDVVIPENVKVIAENAFYSSKLTSLKIPDSVVDIERNAISYCKNLTKVELPNTITSISNGLFMGCSSLTSIEIPESVTLINSGAFAYCEGLVSITLPKKVSEVCLMAFSDCESLESIIINNPETVIYDTDRTISDTATIHGYANSTAQTYAEKYDRNFVLLGEAPITTTTITTTKSTTTTTKKTATTTTKKTATTTTTTLPKTTTSNQTTTVNTTTTYIITEPVITHETSGTCGASGDNLTWAIDDEGTLTISGEGEMDSWVIDSPWYRNDAIKKVVIEEGVTSIGSYAFYYCKSISDVSIPESVTEIGSEAFEETQWLKAQREINPLVVVNGILIDGDTCKGDVVIPDTVTIIAGDAFDTDELTSVKIPDSVKSIGRGAFQYCENLTSVELPEGITIIENQTFWGDENLTSVNIPESVTRISSDAFYECKSLDSVTIPKNVEHIASGAFHNCENLKSITIENPECDIDASVRTISPDATIYGYKGSTAEFYANTYSREFVAISEPPSTTTATTTNDPTVTTTQPIISIVASGECGAEEGKVTWTLDSMGTLTISGEGEMLDMDMCDCPWQDKISDIKNVVIEKGITSVGADAFNYCENLVSVTIPDGVTEIGAYAFLDCKSLESITIPDGVKEIGAYAFHDCRSLETITIPDSVTNIGDKAFAGTTWLIAQRKINPLVIINGTLIDGFACEGEVVIPDNVKRIGGCAFLECEGLTSVVIPDSVTSIGKCAFIKSFKLKSVTIPESLTDIATDAFHTTQWFNSLTRNNSPAIINGILLDGRECVGDFVIPDNVTRIASGAFQYNDYITSVVIPDSVTAVGGEAFYECESLKSVVIGNGVKTIESHAFWRCEALTSVTIENPTCNIYHSEVTIPDSATIYGYTDSTAEAYAEKYNREFISLGEKPVENKLGDVNVDNSVDSSDASAVLAEYAKVQTGGAGELTALQKFVADVNKDGYVDSSDASKILAYYAEAATGKVPEWD